MKWLLIGHQGFGNRGCEALVRATAAMLRQRDPKSSLWVPSSRIKADERQWPQAREHGVHFIPAPEMPGALVQWGRICRLMPWVAAARWPQTPLDGAHREALKACDGVLSIGGDNCTLDYGLPSLALYTGMAEAAMQMGKPVVLWGASVGPFDAWPAVALRMQAHLRRLAAITVRESISHEGLMNLRTQLDGTPGKNAMPQPGPRVLPVSDPAFTLEPQAVDLEPHWPSTNRPVLGLNLSPLAGPRAVEVGAAFARVVIGNGHAVALVPHVSALDEQGRPVQAISPQQDDVPLLDGVVQQVRDALGADAPIRRLPAWNAAQLKHAISHCDSFIGARTHSVIAALSSGVPAVALSYSHKARGIHRDLMGSEVGVVPMRVLDAPTLMAAWVALQARHERERGLLKARLPGWRLRAQQGLHALDEVNARTPAEQRAGRGQ